MTAQRPICRGCGRPMAKAGPGNSGKKERQLYMCTHHKDGCPEAGKRRMSKEDYIRKEK